MGKGMTDREQHKRNFGVMEVSCMSCILTVVMVIQSYTCRKTIELYIPKYQFYCMLI